MNIQVAFLGSLKEQVDHLNLETCFSYGVGLVLGRSYLFNRAAIPSSLPSLNTTSL